MKTVFALIIILLFCTAMLVAEIPSPIPYQGRLTDDTGASVADGQYEMSFSIYNDKTAGKALWTSAPQSIYVTGGLFNYNLGYSPSFPNNLFADSVRYLGITIGSDPEMTPRIRLQSVPYAYQALRADSADYTDYAEQATHADTAAYVSIADDFVLAAGDTMSDDLAFDGDGDGVLEGQFTVNSTSSNITLRSHDSVTTKLYGSDWGELNLFHRYNGHKRVDLSADELGGRLYLYDDEGTQQIRLSASSTGNSSAILPDNAIDSDEIFNEMGFASGNMGSFVYISSTTEMTDIVTATITPPASGYFHISASYTVRLYNTTGANGACFQISSSEGGTIEGAGYTFIHHDEFPTTGSYYFSGHSDKVYHLTGTGTYTFRIEAMKSTSATGNIAITSAKIIARYYPTSYGPIQTIMTDPGDIPNAESVIIEDEHGNTQTAYKVDLRELELKAKETKIKALEAQIELDNAREVLENNNRE